MHIVVDKTENLKPYGPGECGNLRGRPRNAPELKLRGLLGRHLNEIVTREIPDAEGNQHIVQISRMELLVRLMVRTVFEPDPDYPAFRTECLKQILARIDPVSMDGKNGVGQPIVIVVRNEPERVFAEELQQKSVGTGTVGAQDVIDALLVAPCDVTFNGVEGDGAENGDGEG